MKKTISVLISTLWFAANATNYYIAANGNDANSGTSQSFAWQTINKINTFTKFAAGDSILFKRGDMFYGTLIIGNSGVSGSPIVFGSFGSGKRPVITGFTTVTSWKNIGNNLWESASPISTLQYTNLVVIDNAMVPMGRIPNAGTFSFQTFTNRVANTITSSSFTGTANWVGGELALYNTTYSIARNPITSQSGGTLGYTPDPHDISIQKNTQGFIIQNDSLTLDTANEWYYNPSTKKLRTYSLKSPKNVQISTLDSLVYLNGKSFIIFDNMAFTGANREAFYLAAVNHIDVNHCSLNFMGRDGFFGYYTASFGNSIQNCVINNCFNDGINLYYPQWTHTTIKGNTITNCGKWIGMGGNGKSGTGGGTYGGIFCLGADGLIEFNNVDSTGNQSLWFGGDNTIVQYNLFNHADLILKDNGCLYTWNGEGRINTGMKIRNNIILNSPDKGIYLDDYSNNIEVSGNTVAYSHIGYFIHKSWDIRLNNNTAYDNRIAYYVSSNSNAKPHSGNSTSNNIWVVLHPTDTLAFFDPTNLIVPGLQIDSNYYGKPLSKLSDKKSIIVDFDRSNGFTATYRTLEEWQRTYKEREAHSIIKLLNKKNIDESVFKYNATSSTVTISLGESNYTDLKNTHYRGSITLGPYTSVVLIKEDTTVN